MTCSARKIEIKVTNHIQCKENRKVTFSFVNANRKSRQKNQNQSLHLPGRRERDAGREDCQLGGSPPTSLEEDRRLLWRSMNEREEKNEQRTKREREDKNISSID